MSLLLFSFCSVFVIVASVLSVKHKANHAAEESALVVASTLNCDNARDIAESNQAELIVCEIEKNYVYIETFAKFKELQIVFLSRLGQNDAGVTGRAKAK